jgi:glycolate oxidase
MDETSIIAGLRRIVGDEAVLADASELIAYECDGFPVAKAVPCAVAFPADVPQLVACMKLLAREGVQIVPRGSGTGLAGGCVAFERGIILSTSRLNKILSVDLENRMAVVEAGVRNLELTDHVNRLPGGERLHFSPDPSSQRASTIGGNTATNAGGSHTLKYGVTTNHVFGIEFVTVDGDVVHTRFDSMLYDGIGPDLPGLLCGTEGTLGIITKIMVRLAPKAHAFRTIVGIFNSSAASCKTVADVIASGLVPAAMEMMDGAMVKVIEDAFHYGFPTDAQALLLIELDGMEATLDGQMEQVAQVCTKNGARDVQCSADPERRAKLWSARKRAFGAIGRISPSYCTQDACVPRSKLPEVIETVADIGRKYGLTITNVFHAGDGNVHPILLFDERKPEEVVRTMQASYDILDYCISIGGALTGEHGVGVEKLPLMSRMFDAQTMDLFQRIKHTFDPNEVINAGKMIPSDKIVVDLLHPVGAGVPGGAMA